MNKRYNLNGFLSKEAVKVRMIICAFIISLAFPLSSLSQSLFVIADINANGDTPIYAYDMTADGLVFQAEYGVPNHGNGAVGIAVDPINNFLFITYENSDVIQLIDAQTMIGLGTVIASGSQNLAGIVFNSIKSELYVVDRSSSNLYSYSWNPLNISLSLIGLYTIQNSTAWGISLDEANERLYVANNSSAITVFDINTWSLVETIFPEHHATNVAIDVANQILYSGGEFASNYFIDKYLLDTGQKQSSEISGWSGVMGLVVNQGNGLVYCSTGQNSDKDNLMIFDDQLSLIFETDRIGNPTGITTGTAYNPLSFDFTGIPDCMYHGDTLDLSISYQNILASPVNNVLINIILPAGTEFISCIQNCNYLPSQHIIEWDLGTVQPTSAPDVLEFEISILDNFITPTVFEAQIDGTMGQTTISKEITQPIINLGPADTTICPVDSITLYAGGSDNTYLWSTGETTNSISVGTTGVGSPVETVWVSAESGIGCFSTDTITIIFDWAECGEGGINEIIAKYFDIYPNPVDGEKLFIQPKESFDWLNVSLFDNSGQKVFELQNQDSNKSVEVNISGFPKGIYMLNLETDLFNWDVKIIII